MQSVERPKGPDRSICWESPCKTLLLDYREVEHAKGASPRIPIASVRHKGRKDLEVEYSRRNSYVATALPPGVMCVLPTPFTDDGRVDMVSLSRLANYAIDQGATALVCFGLASEGFKLSDKERAESLATVLETVGNRVPLIAGSENNSVETAAARTEDYVEAGVSAVMTMPPSFVKPNAKELKEYYKQVAIAASGLPVIIQDAPGWTGVDLPVELIRELRDSAQNITAVKIENPPNHRKIADLRALGFVCVGGYGGLHLLEDVDAGITSVMYGAGSLHAMVDLWQTLGIDQELAWEKFQRLLPLLTFQMSSLDVFVAVQKQLLKQAGVIDSTRHREPGQPLTDHQVNWLASLIRRWEKSLP